MRRSMLWLIGFVLFCSAAWYVVENGINMDLRTQTSAQNKLIEDLTNQVKATQAKADNFHNNLLALIPDKVEVVHAAYVAQFGEVPPVVVPSAPAKR